MGKRTLLTNFLDHFRDCCENYFDHKWRKPEQGSTTLLAWQINNQAHEGSIASAGRLLAHSTFSEEEKRQIAERLDLLVIQHKDNEFVMSHIDEIRKRQSLPIPQTIKD